MLQRSLCRCEIFVNGILYLYYLTSASIGYHLDLLPTWHCQLFSSLLSNDFNWTKKCAIWNAHCFLITLPLFLQGPAQNFETSMLPALLILNSIALVCVIESTYFFAIIYNVFVWFIRKFNDTEFSMLLLINIVLNENVLFFLLKCRQINGMPHRSLNVLRSDAWHQGGMDCRIYYIWYKDITENA